MEFLDQLSPTDRALFEQQKVDIDLLDDLPNSPLLPSLVATEPKVSSEIPAKTERQPVAADESTNEVVSLQSKMTELSAVSSKVKRGTSTKKRVREQATPSDDEFTERINLHLTAAMMEQIEIYTSHVLRRIPRIRKSLQPEVVRALLALILSDPQRCEAAMLDIIKRYKQTSS